MTLMTKEQALATKPDLTAWVGASAGTGKTHVLTARVLRLMLTGTRPDQILCLTFTKAAAAEMKNRILEELGSWVSLQDGELKTKLFERVNETPDEEMMVTARRLFAQVLDLPGGLAIQTFHSFCQSLLGRFPLEAGIRPGFEVMDESLMDEALRDARDKTLASTRDITGIRLRKYLDMVAILATESSFDDLMTNLNYKRGALASALLKSGNEEQLVAALWNAIGANKDDNEATLCASSTELSSPSAIKIFARDLLEFGGTRNVANAQNILDFFASGDTASHEVIQGYVNAFMKVGGDAKSLSFVATKKFCDDNPEAESLILCEQERLLNIELRRRRFLIAERSEALVRLGLSLLAGYRTTKAHRGVVDFDDMIAKTVDLLASDDIAPWVLFKMDGALSHILVDEAQDSNALQWQVVEKLSDEFFSGDSAREATRTMFAVGDAKQSVYRFQGADPDEFAAARDRVFHKAKASGANYAPIPLNLSFRSGQAVLKLVDAVFDTEGPAHHGLTSDGEVIEHKFHRIGHGGRVELWPTEKPIKKEALEPWAVPDVQETADEAAQRLAWKMAEHIQSLIGKDILESKARLVSAGDIMVLVQRRHAFVDYLVRSLKALGVPVSGRDRMTLNEELPVLDLLALGRFTLQPEDDLTLATLLKSPFIGISEDTLFTLAHGREKSLWQSLKQQAEQEPELARAVLYLKEILQLADSLPPFEFYSQILGTLGGRKKLIARLSDEINDPVDEFLEQALAFEHSHAPSLEAFVDSIERSALQLKREMEESDDRVRIMTVHGAKGLQAPIVYLPDTDQRVSRKGKDLLMLEAGAGDYSLPVWKGGAAHCPETEQAEAAKEGDDDAEYRRLLYVALTRAEDRLYISGWETKNGQKEDSWYSLIETAFAKLPDVSDIIDDNGETIKRYRVAHTAKLDAIKQEDVELVEKLALPAWVSTPIPSEPAPARPLAPSRPSDLEPAVNSPLVRKSDQRYRRGRLIHALMQWLPDVEIDNRESLAVSYLAQPTHGLSEGDQIATWQEVERILNDSKFAAIFGPGSRAEVSLSGLVGETTISAQVDRLLVEEHRVLIIDYKSNRPAPVSESGVADIYRKQMCVYAEALKVIYPDKKVEAALLWTDEARLMPLDV